MDRQGRDAERDALSTTPRIAGGYPVVRGRQARLIDGELSIDLCGEGTRRDGLV